MSTATPKSVSVTSAGAAQTTPAREFVWTEAGRFRVAALIQATFDYNRKANLQPNSFRTLGEMSGIRWHNAVSGYGHGRIADPNRAGCKVLRLIAPFIYRVDFFEAAADRAPCDRILKVVHHQPGHISNAEGYEYWKLPDVTYADDWVALVSLGESSGSTFERVIQVESATPADKLAELMASLDPFCLSNVARLIRVPLPTLRALICGGRGRMDKSQFSSLAQVIQDFLVRITEAKADVWDAKALHHAIGDDGGIDYSRLVELASGSGSSPSQQECVVLAAVMQEYGLDWRTEELEILATMPAEGSQTFQRQIPLLDPQAAELNGRYQVNNGQPNGQPLN